MNEQILKKIIAEELSKVLKEDGEQQNSQKLKIAAQLMAIKSTYLGLLMSELQGGGRPPQVMVNNLPFFQWVIQTSGLQQQQIEQVAQQIQLPKLP